MIFADRPKLAEAGCGAGVDALHISTVSIVDRSAVCSETAFSRKVMGVLPPYPCLEDFIPQTPSLGTRVRGTRIVVSQAALLAIPDAPPRFSAHRARSAPVPQTPSSLRACLKQFFLIFLYFSRFSVPDSTR